MTGKIQGQRIGFFGHALHLRLPELSAATGTMNKNKRRFSRNQRPAVGDKSNPAALSGFHRSSFKDSKVMFSACVPVNTRCFNRGSLGKMAFKGQ
jgi:hypothetical protein